MAAVFEHGHRTASFRPTGGFSNHKMESHVILVELYDFIMNQNNQFPPAPRLAIFSDSMAGLRLLARPPTNRPTQCLVIEMRAKALTVIRRHQLQIYWTAVNQGVHLNNTADELVGCVVREKMNSGTSPPRMCLIRS